MAEWGKVQVQTKQHTARFETQICERSLLFASAAFSMHCYHAGLCVCTKPTQMATGHGVAATTCRRAVAGAAAAVGAAVGAAAGAAAVCVYYVSLGGARRAPLVVQDKYI